MSVLKKFGGERGEDSYELDVINPVIGRGIPLHGSTTIVWVTMSQSAKCGATVVVDNCVQCAVMDEN